MFEHAGNAHHRADGVDADAVGAQFHRHGLRQHIDGALGRVVPAEARPRTDAGRRAHVQDHAALLLAHHRHDCLGHVVDRLPVDVEHAVEHGLVHLQHRLVLVGDGGVVDDDVDRAELFLADAHHVVDVGAVGHVGLHGQRSGADFGLHAVGGFLIDVGDDNFRAFLGVQLDDAFAETTAAARDDSNLALQLTHDLSPDSLAITRHRIG
ncbi:hypothetical protein G6F31_017415 [Rhizopus arrhizus]|nr:hypothetical protein G6F31_017415 [Rhizopus arrhizus]